MLCAVTATVGAYFGGMSIHQINEIDYVNLYRGLYFSKGDLINRNIVCA